MGQFIRQTNFRSGELSPFLWGRTDLGTFHSGLRTCRNFFITRHGAAVSRPGTGLVGRSKYFDGGIPGALAATYAIGNTFKASRARLIPFNAGDGIFESYALEFGFNYVRFICNGAYVESAPGVPYERETPYTDDDVFALQFAQIGDELVLACPECDPLVLKRHAHSVWTLEYFRFKAFQPYASDIGGASTPTTGFVIDRAYGGGTVLLGLPVADIDHPAREWQWMWTALVRDNESGVLYETLGELISESMLGDGYDTSAHPLSTDHFPIFLDRPIRLARAETAGLISPPEGAGTYTVEEYLMYRGRGGLFGLVGSTKSREFIDVGFEPNYAVQPPLGNHPWSDATEATKSAVFPTRHLDRPSAVAFFEDRIFFGGITRFPGDWFCSKAGDFQNWNSRLYIDVDGESLHFQLAARRRERIRSFVVLGRLLAMTSVSAWSVGGVQGSPLEFDSVACRVEEEIGSTGLQPLVVDGSALYARAKGRGVRALIPTGQEAPVAGADVSQVAHHLFVGNDKELVDWCYAEDPFGIIWAVQADGTLLSFTYSREAGAGWARHDTDGLVESVCAIPEGDEDAVYVVVKRTINGQPRRYIERMTSRVVRGGAEADATPALTIPPDDICIDSALEYFGPAGISTLTGLDHLEGKDVWVLVQGLDPIGPLTVAGGQVAIGKKLKANVTTDVGPKLVVHAGLAFTCDLETLDVGDKLLKKAISHAGFEVDHARGIQGGINFDSLNDFDQRTLDDGYNPVSNATVLAYMAVPSEWSQSARLVLRQELPLPITVVGITREVEGGG